MRKTVCLLLVVSLSTTGCATMFDGKTQAITVNTSPPQAKCIIHRQGQDVGTVSETPGSVVIDKTRDDITIACDKLGYQQSTYLDKSGVAGWTFANILFGGLIGLAIDYGTGAINKYDSPVNMTLAPSKNFKDEDYNDEKDDQNHESNKYKK